MVKLSVHFSERASNSVLRSCVLASGMFSSAAYGWHQMHPQYFFLAFVNNVAA